MNPSTPACRRHVLDRLLLIGSVLALLTVLAPTAVLATQPDAERWERAEVPSLPAGVDLWDVTAGGPGFIAVGGGFADGATVPSALILTSSDGLAWERVDLAGDARVGVLRSVSATADGYVAVGSAGPGSAAAWRSADGVAWERVADQAAFSDALMLGVTEADGTIVAVGCSGTLECSGGLAWTSSDGVIWSEPVPLDFLPLGVATTSAGVLGLGTSAPYGAPAAVALSADGSAWPPAVVVTSSGSLHAAIDRGDGILALGGTTNERNGHSDTLAFASADGQLWQPFEAPGLKKVWVEDVVALPDGWLLVGWESKQGAQVPATVLVGEPGGVRQLRFPKEVKEGGSLHAGAASPDASTTVVVGSTVLNRGQVPTVWVRRSEADSPG